MNLLGTEFLNPFALEGEDIAVGEPSFDVDA